MKLMAVARLIGPNLLIRSKIGTAALIKANEVLPFGNRLDVDISTGFDLAEAISHSEESIFQKLDAIEVQLGEEIETITDGRSTPKIIALSLGGIGLIITFVLVISYLYMAQDGNPSTKDSFLWILVKTLWSLFIS